MITGIKYLTAFRQNKDTSKREPLDETKIHHVEFIHEEEKLARDVYIDMAAKLGNAIFSLVIQSEQRHMYAMFNLLEKYGSKIPSTMIPSRHLPTNISAVFLPC